MAAARRWVPWICAYTGARVNEITQLTPADFGIEEGFHYIRLDATATKTRDYRKVPLHEHLLEEGLLNYVRSRGKRPLFYDPKRSRGGDGLHFRKVGERLAEWVRNTVGVVDKEVQPESRVAAPLLIVGARGRHARGRSEHYPGPCRGEDRFRLRRRMGVDSPSRDIKAAPLHCPVMSDWACKHRHAGGLSGDRIPPSPPPIFGSEKVLQNQAFLEPPVFGGGAPRWSTVVTQIAIIVRPFKAESASNSPPTNRVHPAWLASVRLLIGGRGKGTGDCA